MRPFVAFVVVLVAGGCSAPASPPPTSPTSGTSVAPPPPRKLDPSLTGWLPQNRERLDALLGSRGRGSPGYDPAHPPVATFDWDNTMMKNDIGDATMAWILAHDQILQPPGRNWAVTSSVLTPAALAELHAACDALAEPGRPLPTRENPPCTDAIYAVYDGGKTPKGEPGWTKQITMTNDEPDTWLARLLAGHTPAEVEGFARAAYREASAAPVGARHAVGSAQGVTAYVRIYPEMKDLVAALQQDGFDVWVVSASPQHVVQVVSAEVGIGADHTIGIRTQVDAEGRLGRQLEPCGESGETVITYHQGKRCFINKVVFHQPPSAQLAKADAAHRQAFAAGDSDTDVAFVQDATDLKLTLDRGKVALECNARANAGGKWLLQPMFVEPMAPRTTPYPCSTTADPAGRPLVDEDGKPIADQPG